MLEFYNYATYTFILATLFCSIVRLFHMCRPFAPYADYFYPSRIETSILFFYAATLQIPYFIYNEAEWNIRYITVIFLLSFASFYTLLLVRYFIKKPNKLTRILLILGAMLPSLPYFIDGLCGGRYLFAHTNFIMISSLIIGIIVFGGFIYSVYCLIVKIRHYNLSNYSSEEDFPTTFAYKVLFFSGISAMCFWGNWIIESQMATAIMHITLSAMAVLYLLLVLHPQHPSSYQCTFPKDPTQANAEKEDNKTSYDMQNLAKSVHSKIYTDKLYLNAHLSLIQLATEIGYGRTITSKVCNEYYGGFYKLVNEARVAHAKQLQKEHPEYTQETIAKESGFSNRSSFIRVKKRLEEEN